MKIVNKKAKFNYQIFDKLETGIILTGPEVKSVKLGHISLAEAFVRLIGGDLFLLNANISPYKFADNENYDPKRSRKLLAKKAQINKLAQKIETKNISLVPTAIYTKNNLIKLEIAEAKGKKEFEKREAKKKKDQKREQQRILKNYN